MCWRWTICASISTRKKARSERWTGVSFHMKRGRIMALVCNPCEFGVGKGTAAVDQRQHPIGHGTARRLPVPPPLPLRGKRPLRCRRPPTAGRIRQRPHRRLYKVEGGGECEGQLFAQIALPSRAIRSIQDHPGIMPRIFGTIH